jgi:hypothetical protein
VGFYLVERQFDFPALVVGGGQLECGSELLVGDRGDEAEQLSAAGSVFDRVLDDPDEDGLDGLGGSPAAAAARSISRRRPRVFGLISNDR